MQNLLKKIHRKHQIFFLVLFVFISLASSADTENISMLEAYGLLPQNRSVTISPDGKHVAFIKRIKSIDYFVVMKLGSNQVVASFDARKMKARRVYFATSNHIILLGSKTVRNVRHRNLVYTDALENSRAFVYNLKTKKVRMLLRETTNLHPAQTGLGRIIGVNVEKQQVYMPAFTGISGRAPLNLYRVNLKTGVGKIHAKGKANNGTGKRK